MNSPIAAAILCGLVLCSSVFGEDSPIKPKELDALRQYVGHWTSEVTSKPAVWNENSTRFRTVSQAEMILDGWFLQQIEVQPVVGDADKATKSMSLWTYDPKLEKVVTWVFQSNGAVASWTGKWDSTNNAFTLASIEPPPNATGKMTEQFLDAKTINGNLTFVDGSGKSLMDLVWTRTRQSESDGKPSRKEWSQIGTAIPPLPDELKRLQPLIGEWDSDIITGPFDDSGKSTESKGTMSIRWILDGRYLLITTENGDDRFYWVIGYDSNKKKYQRLTFTNTGQVSESLGSWNGEFDHVNWTTHNQPPGPTKIGQDYIGIDNTSRGQGTEVLAISILTVDANRKYYQKFGSRSSRRK
jgi:hypothetical protein